MWGDFFYTRPERIGRAALVSGDDHGARRAADEHGFKFEDRLHNGFEPWAAAYTCDDDHDQEFEFAKCPIVRGWQKI